MFFINAVYWLWAFSVPVIVLGIPALLLYLRSGNNLPFAILLLVLGAVLGFILAEWIRKKEGLSSFFSRLTETPDIEDRNDPRRHK